MGQCETWVDETLEKVREKMEWVSEKNRNKIPFTTDENGNYDDRSDPDGGWDEGDGLNWWTNGFWAGMMWLLYQDTKEERYAQIARISEERLEKCLQEYYWLHHDVGFMFVHTSVADYRLTGNPTSRRNALHAANLLAGRFNPAGKFLRAWNDSEDDTRGWAIIDCMMNLSLLYWASEESKDPRFRQIAMLHGDTTMRYFIRPDGSSCHIVTFNPETGEMLGSLPGQGYGEGSSWTRGQGWAIYGFTISYIHTGKREYLETARRVADYCVAHVPPSGIIPVDFCQPPEPAYEDSCGACVMAGGLLELSRQLPEREGAPYRETARKILRAIARERADFTTNCDAIVRNCSGAYHSPEHHTTMSYADYFFMEGLYKMKGIGRFMW